jgi:hypothetical protein
MISADSSYISTNTEPELRSYPALTEEDGAHLDLALVTVRILPVFV